MHHGVLLLLLLLLLLAGVGQLKKRLTRGLRSAVRFPLVAWIYQSISSPPIYPDQFVSLPTFQSSWYQGKSEEEW